MKNMKRLLALLLAVAMTLSMAACGQQAKPDQTEDPNTLDRDDKELIAQLIGGEDASDMTDEDLDALVEQLIGKEDKQSTIVNLSNTEKQDLPTVDMAANKDAYDENGAMKEPFDQVYPELIEEEKVQFSGESILIKLENGTLTDGLKAAGIGALKEIVPLEGAAWYEAMLTEGTDAKAALAAVRTLNEVLLAEYNYEIQTAALDDYKHFDDKTDKEFKKNGHNKDQWHQHYCGIPDGFEEMETEGGLSSVVVAVIDSGVDYDHEDLKDNMWYNAAETPNNGIDDDKNGYVDDYYGIDLIAGKGSADDDNGHGTHVAGIIAARNNNTGVVGIAYGVKIMPIKAAMHNGTLNQADIAEAILYAYEMGAEVINMSFGGSASSIAVQDALASAYSRCVLVASAGNNGYPNQKSDHMPALPNYPAALSYVLGVMSVDENGVESSFSNWDTYAFNGVEYEVYAPGENIMSTLPNNQYGFLTGTSMAAPIVSAFAAILRSEFTGRDMYPTEFIYGQLASTSDYHATCLDPKAHAVDGMPHNLPQIVNLDAALTKLPKPEVNLQDYAIFDSKDLSSKNNGDGVIDAGETIALGLTLRNRWGMSENTLVTLDTLENGIADPYVQITNPTVNYGSIGTYTTGDCGQIKTDGLLTGWENPFIIQVADDIPNDYRMTFHVTITCENALDEADETTYTSKGAIDITARNGVVLPSIIEEDMVLTADNLYIIPNSTVIQTGATVRVQPGTHIQFWSDDPADPYASNYIAYLLVNGKFLVEGTKENPVYIYPSQLMDHYGVEISAGSTGYVSMKYADVTNLFYYSSNGNHTGTGNKINLADHCTFRTNYGKNLRYRYLSGGSVQDSLVYSYTIGTLTTKDCVFYKLGYNNTVTLNGSATRCIFVDCGLSLSASTTDCVFLGNSFVDQTSPNSYYPTAKTISAPTAAKIAHVYYCEETGTTYATGTGNALALAEYGLKPTIIETQEELDWLLGRLSSSLSYGLGIQYNGEEYVWNDGTEIGRFVDPDGIAKTTSPRQTLRLSTDKKFSVGSYSYMLYELPGHILPTEITFKEYETNIDLETTYQIMPVNKPVQLPLDAFTYASSDESVLTVSDTGLVTPLKKGTADVYVYSEDRAVWNYITFQVVDYVALESATFPMENLRLAYGESISAGCVLSPVNTTRKNVIYTSSDETVAVVDAGGNVTAVGFGNATITATIEDFILTLSVEVIVPTLSFNSDEMWVAVGKSKKVPVSIDPANTDPSAISYQSSDENILVIGNDGTMTGLAQGQVTITAQCGPLVIESLVDVVIPTQLLTFKQSAVGVALTDQAVALPGVDITDGSSVNLHWQSTDEEVAEIIDGQLQLKKAGSTTIIATDRYSGLSASTILFVHSKKMPQIVKLDNSYVQYADGSLYSWDAAGSTLQYENVVSWSANGQLFAALADGTLIIGNETRTDLQGKTIINAVSSYHSSYSVTSYFAVTEEGEVYAMGGNSYGQLGIGSASNSGTFQKVVLDAKIVQVGTSSKMSYFLAENGDLYVAGGASLQATTPILMGRNVSNLSVSSLHGAVYTSSDNLIYLNDSASAPYTVTTIDTYDWIYFDNGYSTSNSNFKYIWGVGSKDGDIYRLQITFNPSSGTISAHTETKISGITNVVTGYIYNANYQAESEWIYLATEDGLIHRVCQGKATHYALEAFPDNDLKLTDTNVTDGMVYDPEFLQLSFNKSLVSCSSNSISLYEDGIPHSTAFNMSTNKLILDPNSVSETTYKLVIEPGALVGINGSTNSQTIEVSFFLKFEEEEVLPEEPEVMPDTPEVVIHESKTDTTIARIPTVASLNSALTTLYNTLQINSSFYGNAILNPVSTDTKVTHWFRPQASSVSAGTYTEIPLGGNYWGTTNQTAIELQMVDYTDYISYARLMYAPYLTEAPEDTFPFVTDVKLINKYGEEVTTVGNEQITFRVTFNRDMNTSIPLQVRFGSAYPYGDYEIMGSYVDARTWEGTYTLNTVIENGNQFFSISNGCSATDDLELQPDVARFGFVIDTSAAQALIMQGTATDTGVELRWTQDDFDTLMGYNVYRATKIDGLYTRLNKTVIPADTMTFFDDTVEPGVVYYYNFTVVKTDLTESEPSGKISIMSKDTMAPNIYHSPAGSAFTGANLMITATITDNLNIAYANLYYRVTGTETWSTIRMNKLNDKYSAIIPAAYVTVEGIEYYIEAFDGVSYTYKATAEAPYAVAVQEAISADALGDVDGDGAITNLDALLILYAANGKHNMTAEEMARADLNGDGRLWAAEALQILRYVSGEIGSVKMQ